MGDVSSTLYKRSQEETSQDNLRVAWILNQSSRSGKKIN